MTSTDALFAMLGVVVVSSVSIEIGVVGILVFNDDDVTVFRRVNTLVRRIAGPDDDNTNGGVDAVCFV